MSFVFTFIMVLVIRAFVFETFTIPTGSMAPTLMGQHLEFTCKQCGYTFQADALHDPNRRPLPGAICPMCNYPNPLKQATLRSGDRITVIKLPYALSSPKRWDVVVFKNPQLKNADNTPGPHHNYIKRLVGLPNESIAFLDGNVYTQPLDPETAKPVGPWRIARKSDNLRAQRDLFRPIYHANYIPFDGGTGSSRNFEQPNGNRVSFTWKNPWVADVPTAWDMDMTSTYTHTATTKAKLTFDFSRSNKHTVYNMYPYNQLRPFHPAPEPIEDIRLSLDFTPKNAAGTLTLSTTARWDRTSPTAPPQILAAIITPDGRAQLTRTSTNDPADTQVLSQTENIPPLQAGSSAQLEFWHVDQHLILWINGKQILTAEYDLPMEQLRTRRGPAPTPNITIQSSAGSFSIDNLRLDRDLFYASLPSGRKATGGLIRPNANTSVILGKPFPLHRDEFFCVGDNGPASNDSRLWEDVDPWVDHIYFNDTKRIGVVPRDFMLGRAFYVIMPAAKHFTPKFQDMRFIH